MNAFGLFYIISVATKFRAGTLSYIFSISGQCYNHQACSLTHSRACSLYQKCLESLKPQTFSFQMQNGQMGILLQLHFTKAFQKYLSIPPKLQKLPPSGTVILWVKDIGLELKPLKFNESFQFNDPPYSPRAAPLPLPPRLQ